MELRRRVTLFAVTIAVTVAAGCLGPSLPLPPPTGAASYDLTTGTATVTGRANPGAYVFCLRAPSDTGVIGRASTSTGDYSLTIPAAAGDGLDVWQEVGTTTSSHLSLVVPGGPSMTDH